MLPRYCLHSRERNCGKNSTKRNNSSYQYMERNRQHILCARTDNTSSVLCGMRQQQQQATQEWRAILPSCQLF